MFPWFSVWAPHIQLPWSGNVVQDIDPTTNWFFGAIKPDAGNAVIEQKAFEVASYGKQLGLLTELLIDLAEQAATARGPEASEALSRLKDIRSQIEAIKSQTYATELKDVEARAAAIRPKLKRASAARTRK
jgi:hypothetical protein